MIIVFIRTYVLLFITAALFGQARATTLEHYQVESATQNASMVTFFFNKKPVYKHFTLKNPSRLVFDFSDLTLKQSLEKLSSKSPLIKELRFAHKDEKIMRLVLEVEKDTQLSIDDYISRKGAQLKLTLFSVKPKQAPRDNRTIASFATLPSSLNKQPARDVIVVIDPGHGGKDPGAMGAKNNQEKNIVLQISKKLKQLVDKQVGMKAYLTRRGDYYVGLRQRLALARKYNADIFISIHADAFLNRKSRGASVYSLSQRGATSEAARWLAASENHSELGGVDLSELDDDNGMIRSVLIDLSQTVTTSSSFSLGDKVLKGLKNIALLHHDEVEQARFVVLKSPDIPSILVETGFISNHAEERLLTSQSYQNKLAHSILNGVSHYFKAHPPRDSVLALRKSIYHVVRGDTLSGIAKKFKVSMNQIKEKNHLKHSSLYIGQKLEVYF